MPSVAIKTVTGKDAGTMDLHEAVFSVPKNEVLVREVYNAFMANQRQGTHSTKTRGMVSGGGRKPWRQKGTGRARQGSIRSPQWRGGAIIFGPSPRDYREKVNRRKRRAALCSVLTARLEEGNIIVMDEPNFSVPRTKDAMALLDAVGADGKTLILTSEVNENLVIAMRNIPWVRVEVANCLNIYDLLVADTIIATRAALETVQSNLLAEKE